MTSRPFRGSGLARLTMSLAIGAMCAAPAFAQKHDGKVDFRIWGGAAGRYVLSDNGTFDSPGFGTVALKVDGSKPTVGADAEYRFHRWIGLDAAVDFTSFTIDETSTLSPSVNQANLKVVPALVSLNVHLISTNVVDFWVGPQVGYFIFHGTPSFQIGSAGTFTYTPSNSWSWKGFAAGADIGIDKVLALNVQFRWQNGDGDSNGHLTIDPALATAGITIRF